MLKLFFISLTFSVIIISAALLTFAKALKTFDFQKDRYPLYTVYTVRNIEDKIEYTLRRIASKMCSGKNRITELIIIDLDSDDNTPDILKKISTEYPFMHFLSITDIKLHKNLFK